MATFQIIYTDLSEWLDNQNTVTRVKTVTAQDQDSAILWFEDNVQGDWDDITTVEEA